MTSKHCLSGGSAAQACSKEAHTFLMQHAQSESPICASADVRQKTGAAATPERVTRDQLRQNASRHRYHFAPPATPPGFWDMGFMDSQVFARLSFAASCDDLPELLDGLRQIRDTKDQHRKNESRHRYHYAPPATYPGFGAKNFMDSQASHKQHLARACLLYCPPHHHRLHCKFSCVPGSSHHVRC